MARILVLSNICNGRVARRPHPGPGLPLDVNQGGVECPIPHCLRIFSAPPSFCLMLAVGVAQRTVHYAEC